MLVSNHQILEHLLIDSILAFSCDIATPLSNHQIQEHLPIDSTLAFSCDIATPRDTIMTLVWEVPSLRHDLDPPTPLEDPVLQSLDPQTASCSTRWRPVVYPCASSNMLKVNPVKHQHTAVNYTPLYSPPVKDFTYRCNNVTCVQASAASYTSTHVDIHIRGTSKGCNLTTCMIENAYNLVHLHADPCMLLASLITSPMPKYTRWMITTSCIRVRVSFTST
jgi:hypothetical protein